jgi:hypothetical protein
MAAYPGETEQTRDDRFRKGSCSLNFNKSVAIVALGRWQKFHELREAMFRSQPLEV